MSWFRRRRGDGAEGPAARPTENRLGAIDGEVFDSPALGRLFEALRQRGGGDILDLGPAVPQNVEALARISARLHIEDLYMGVEERRRSRPDLSGVVRYPPEVVFDAVLAWNLLDYLEPEVLEVALARLADHSRSGTYFHALTGYLSTMPEEPLRFKIESERSLRYEAGSDRTRPAPRLSARDLSLKLPGFRMISSYLLRNGYQEFLFLRE